MGFKGDDYNPKRDAARLRGGLKKVLQLMIDGEPRTIPEIIEGAGVSPMSASRFLRYLRKPEFGGFIVTKEWYGGGLYCYTLEVPKAGEQMRLAV